MTLEKSETTRKSLSYTIYCRTGYWIFTLGGQNWTYFQEFLSWQKLGKVLENEMFENCNYPKKLTTKIVLLNVYFLMKLNRWKIQMIVVMENFRWKSDFGHILRTWHYVSSQNIIISLGVCSILAKNLTSFDLTR